MRQGANQNNSKLEKKVYIIIFSRTDEPHSLGMWTKFYYSTEQRNCMNLRVCSENEAPSLGTQKVTKL